MGASRVLEADDGHAMVVEAAAPAVGTVVFADFACGDEGVVAVVADVVVAVVAGVAVVARIAGRDRVVADVAVLLYGDHDVAVFWEVWKRDRAVLGGNFRGRGGGISGADMGDL